MKLLFYKVIPKCYYINGDSVIFNIPVVTLSNTLSNKKFLEVFDGSVILRFFTAGDYAWFYP